MASALLIPTAAVLANEEVIDGLSERGGHPVVRMPMKQWMLKITAYGDRQVWCGHGLCWWLAGQPGAWSNGCSRPLPPAAGVKLALKWAVLLLGR